LGKRTSITRISYQRNHSRSARGDAETALRLARHFGSSAAIWLRLQVAYDLSHAEAEFPAKIAAEVTPAAA
jgi:plasmid maintenance system antidote protein VapI